jgi:hypothetical protein
MEKENSQRTVVISRTPPLFHQHKIGPAFGYRKEVFGFVPDVWVASHIFHLALGRHWLEAKSTAFLLALPAAGKP